MLTRLAVRGFKSLDDVTVRMPRLSVFFGPNASGKSNLLDAIHALSFIGNARTLDDALGDPFPVRGLAFEAFSFGQGGIANFLRRESARFSLEADLTTENGPYRYRVDPEIDLRRGQLGMADEYLAQLGTDGQPKGKPAIKAEGSKFLVRRRSGAPRREDVGLNHSVLSDRSLSGNAFPWLDQVRAELANWRTYYFEPRLTMRAEQYLAGVVDPGTHGQFIAPFLYRLRADHPKHFEAIVRTLRMFVPDLEALIVELDERRGALNLLVRRSGVESSSRVLSEGTLRLLALCAVVVNPWAGSVVTIEEPENGVHSRCLDLIAELVLSLAKAPGPQVVVATHSPLLVDAILKAGGQSSEVGLFSVRHAATTGTVVKSFTELDSPDKMDRINRVFETAGGDGPFTNLFLRGYVDR